MRVVIHKEGFAIEAFTFFIEILWTQNENFFFVFKKRKWKRKLLKLERKWEMKKLEKIRKRRKKAIMYKWVEKEWFERGGDLY